MPPYSLQAEFLVLLGRGNPKYSASRLNARAGISLFSRNSGAEPRFNTEKPDILCHSTRMSGFFIERQGRRGSVLFPQEFLQGEAQGLFLQGIVIVHEVFAQNLF